MWVKICGITNEEDALLAVALGADALGFMFVPGSPRQVAPETVGEILHRLPSGVVTVGVFRDERPGACRRAREHPRSVGRPAARSGAALRRSLGAPTCPVRDPGLRGRAILRSPRWATVRSTSCWSTPTSRAQEPCSTGRWPTRCRPACACCSRAVCTRETWRRRSSGSARGVSTSASGVETTPGSGRKDARKLRSFITRGAAGGRGARGRRRVGARSQGRALRLDGRR